MQHPAAPAARNPWDPPGGVMIWLLVLLEILTFGLGMIAFLATGRTNVEVFAAGRSLLNVPLAFANTLVLLTGGWCMACGVNELRAGRPRVSARWITAAAGTGLLFLLLKFLEYREKAAHSIGIDQDSFFTFYYLLTGFHCLHVLVAVVILAVLARTARSDHLDAERRQNVEAGGIFWHMCDLIWLLLFPIIYLL